MHKPDARECALLLLLLLRGTDREAGRLKSVRLSELTLKKLWNRNRLTDKLVENVDEWLLSAGWALVYAGSTYGAVQVSVVKNWPRVTYKNLAEELEDVAAGRFDFENIQHLLSPLRRASQIDDEYNE